MRKVTTILCSIAFMISGIMMAISASDPSPGTSYKTMAAATMSPEYVPIFPVAQRDTSTLDIPDDLVRDIAKQRGIQDTVYITKTDTVPVTKVKWCRGPAPDPVVIRDTIRETHYYLATQIGTKEGPMDECIPIYEVHKVDEICPETINSSVQPATELDNDVGE